MIIVVEGISASGKTTWCTAHGKDAVIAENTVLHGIPDRATKPREAAAFWAERNVDRWRAALAMERIWSLALCDTDPLKLHYIWCLWRIGEAAERDWRLELEATRATLAAGRIGFADHYLVGEVEPELARARAASDPMRRRRNFELHVRLQPALLAWYRALDDALPGRVRFGLPARMPERVLAHGRYDVAAFDRLIDALPAA